VLVEQSSQRDDELVVSWLPAQRNVRRRKRASEKPLPIELLVLGKSPNLAAGRAEKRGDVGFAQIVMVHFGVVDGPGADRLVVAAQERLALDLAIVPHERDGARALEDAQDFEAREPSVEPVERLRRNDEIGAFVGKGRRFGRAFDRSKPRPRREPRLARETHGRVRLDADHVVALVEKELRRDSRPRADVDDARLSRHDAELALERAHDVDRIAGPVSHVVVDAIGEARFRFAARDRHSIDWSVIFADTTRCARAPMFEGSQPPLKPGPKGEIPTWYEHTLPRPFK
jgi:hypothetical protein